MLYYTCLVLLSVLQAKKMFVILMDKDAAPLPKGTFNCSNDLLVTHA